MSKTFTVHLHCPFEMSNWVIRLDFLILLWGHNLERDNGVIIALIGRTKERSQSLGNGSHCQIVLSWRIIISFCKWELTGLRSSNLFNKSYQYFYFEFQWGFSDSLIFSWKKTQFAFFLWQDCMMQVSSDTLSLYSLYIMLGTKTRTLLKLPFSEVREE